MSLSNSIKNTLSYTQYFGFPLTLAELHHWLICKTPTPISKIKAQKINHPCLLKKLNQTRLVRLKISNQKIKIAHSFTHLIKFFPAVRLIALTGSLAMKNAKKNDDIDLMVITSPHTLWFTRPLIIFLTSLFFKRRKPKTSPFKLKTSNSICLNLWLDTTALMVPKQKQNLYTAHEVLQAKPLFDRGGVYLQFIKSNSWTKKYLANAYKNTLENHSPKARLSAKTVSFKSNFLAKPLNLLAFYLQYLYMKPKITHETITPHSAYFHPRNLFKKIAKGLIKP